MIGEITEEQLQKVREPIPFTPTKRLERDDVLYVTEDDIPHPIYGYAKAHKEYSVIDLRGYRKGYEPRLEISGIYTPNPEDIFRLQTGKLPPYQPTTTGDKLLAEMRRLGVHKAFRIGKLEEVPAVPEVTNFMEEWESAVPELGVVATFSVDPRTNTVDINTFYVTSEIEGTGSLAMQKMVDIADKYGVTLRGIPTPKQTQFREAMTKGQLIRFYERFGFKVEVVNGVEAIVREPITKPPAVSVIEYDRKYSLSELREKAKQAGLSASGSKKEIATRLIAKGVK